MACLSLAGSTLCPSFQNLYINPTNLSTAWPFFANVNSVETFDTQFAAYIAPGGQFARTKQATQLGCTDYASAGFILQYSQTFLCGEFTGISYSASCNSNITNTMTCQSTCITFAASESALVANATACPTNANNSTRQATLTKDFTQCTDWTSLATNNTATCVAGNVNEPNCGFGNSTSQLCSYCNPAAGQVDACCIGANVNTTASCGFTVAAAQVSGAVSSALPSSTSSSAPASSSTPASSSSSSSSGAAATGAGANSGTSTSGGHHLSGGAIAGIVIGVLAFLAILAALLFLCCRRKRGATGGGIGSHDSPEMTAAGTPSTYYKNAEKSSPISSFNAQTPPEKNFGGMSYSSPALLPAAATIGAASASLAPSSRPISGATQLTNFTQTTSSSGNDGRVLISSFQDLYSPAQITPDSQVEAIYAYNPTLSDELQLSPGDTVTVVKLFDDNWANGTIEDADGTTRNGAFPLVCVTAARGVDSSTSRGSFEAARTAPSGYATDADQSAYASAHSDVEDHDTSGPGESTSFHTAGTEVPREREQPAAISGHPGYWKEIFPSRRS